jgi:hypothetical protein
MVSSSTFSKTLSFPGVKEFLGVRASDRLHVDNFLSPYFRDEVKAQTSLHSRCVIFTSEPGAIAPPNEAVFPWVIVEG